MLRLGALGCRCQGRRHRSSSARWSSTRCRTAERRIRGLVLGPREADPVIHGRSWVAWAVGPNGAKVSGKGESPEDALLQLTVELKRVSA